MGKQINIKKYSNRKLYNMDGCRYTSLGEIQLEIKAGNSVIVTDYLSKEDITTKTLLQSLIGCNNLVNISNNEVIELIKRG